MKSETQLEETLIYPYRETNFAMTAVRDDPAPQCFATDTETENAATDIQAAFFSFGSHSRQCRSSERARQLSLESDWKVLDSLDCLEVLEETGSNISKNTGAAILN